jgi:hypothetical protein
LRRIREREFEHNELLQQTYPDVLWEKAVCPKT